MTKSRIWGAARAPKSFLYGCYNLFIYLDYPKTAVLSCTFAIKYMFFFQKARCNKDDISKYIAGLQDPFKDKYEREK